MEPIPPRYRISSYRFDLPEDRIAQVPAVERTESRLLVLERRGGIQAHARFSELPAYLSPGDCLVLNDTRVIPARLFARKPTGGLVEVFAVRTDSRRFSAITRTHRGLKPDTVLRVLDRRAEPTHVQLRVEAIFADGLAELSLVAPDGLSFRDILARFGHVPVPPYIRRTDDRLHELDKARYQTVYARRDGAVAAPTAGLHFDCALLDRLRQAGVETLFVTLHVGPGTFRPIRDEDIRAHQVDPEFYEMPRETAERLNWARQEGRRIVAVGTTVVRVLETLGARGPIEAGEGFTSLTILPGHRFRIVNALITNFHLPGSSLLVLVSAFAGRERVLRAYREAIRLGYRFYSYGDAMLIE